MQMTLQLWTWRGEESQNHRRVEADLAGDKKVPRRLEWPHNGPIDASGAGHRSLNAFPESAPFWEVQIPGGISHHLHHQPRLPACPPACH